MPTNKQIEEILERLIISTANQYGGYEGRDEETDLDILKAHHALSELLIRERIDEVKHALNKGYFIPEMEVYAENRITDLQSQLTNKETQQ